MITRFLIVLNLIGYAWEISVGGSGMLTGFAGDGIERVLSAGAIVPANVLVDGQWWRIVTGAFLHGGLVHLGVNMVSLWVLGSFIESALGSWRMLLVYFFSLVVSGLGVVYLHGDPTVATVGASGAIFGLFGALFAIGFKLGKPGMDLVRANVGILVLNLIITFTVPAIAWQAHVAGLLGGFLLTLAIYSPPRRLAPLAYDSSGHTLETEYESPAEPRSPAR